MANPGLSALVISLCLAAFYITSSSSHVPSSNHPDVSAFDILSLLGTPGYASSMDPAEAQNLTSCLKFLVPFIPPVGDQPTLAESDSPLRRELSSESGGEDGLVWWPSAPVMDLARLAVESGAAAVQAALDPTVIPVPSIEGSKEARCELTSSPFGKRFVNEELNSYLEFLFKTIVARGPSVGLNVSLNRYDFFSGHMFVAAGSGRLGVLFHAKDYPAYDDESFPHHMGYCQKGSSVTYDAGLMNLRNILWLAPLPSKSTNAWLASGVLVVLDARPDGIIYRDIIPEYVDDVRTIYEENFGDHVAEVNYLNVGGSVPDYKIFIC